MPTLSLRLLRPLLERVQGHAWQRESVKGTRRQERAQHTLALCVVNPRIMEGQARGGELAGRGGGGSMEGLRGQLVLVRDGVERRADVSEGVHCAAERPGGRGRGRRKLYVTVLWTTMARALALLYRDLGADAWRESGARYARSGSAGKSKQPFAANNRGVDETA